MSKPAVFLDRDGTLIEDADFLTSPEGIRILPNAIPGLQKLHDAGYLLVVLTNQSGLARGLLTEEDLGRIHARLIEQIQLLGGHIDAIYYCPHLPEGSVAEYAVDCDCRKPRPGLFTRARDDLDIDLERSFAVGDAWRDVEAALGVGLPAVKLPRPAGREELPRRDLAVLAEARDLLEAAEIILATTPEAARAAISAKSAAAAEMPPPAPATVQPPANNSVGAVPRLSSVEGEREPPASKPVEPEFDASLDASPALRSFEEAQTVRPPATQPACRRGRFEHRGQPPAQPERPAAMPQPVPARRDGPAGPGAMGAQCARCGAAISAAEVASGAAAVARGNLLCPDCLAAVSHRAGRETPGPGTAASLSSRPSPPAGDAARLPARPQSQPADPPGLESAVRDILFELRRVARRQAEGGETFDLPWVLGVLGQTAALFLAVGMPLLRWAEAPLWLLAAVFAQIFALTMFLLSRSKK